MKKLFFFASAMMAALTMHAQTTTTITVDGNASEWANVPMVTEPGDNTNVLKYALTQEGLSVGTDNAFAVMLKTTKTIAGTDPAIIYVDADKSSATGQQTPWFIPSMYRDYELGITDGGDGITGAVRSTNVTDGIIELTMPASAFSTVPFTGSFWGCFSYKWGNFYVPNSPEPSGDNWKWSQNYYQPVDVRPYAYTALTGTHAFADTWSRHQCIALGDSMNFNVSGGLQDTAFWCAWTVEITTGAKYDVSANMVSDNGSSCDFYLVDVATNKVVATLMSEADGYYQPAGATTIGEWDLSAVPAGKYMLKVMNHIQWSHMKLVSVTLTAQTTAVSEVAAEQIKAEKRMINGQLIIVRGEEMFTVDGQRL